MNKKIEDLMYHAGLTAQGCWDEMDDYDRKAIEKFAELIVRECVLQCNEALVPQTGQPSMTHNYAVGLCQDNIQEHFGVEE